MYNHLTLCANRVSTCTGLAAAIPICGLASAPCLTLAATTDHPENNNAALGSGGDCWTLAFGTTPVTCWHLNLAENLQSSVALGLDMYNYDKSSIADFMQAFTFAETNGGGHAVFVEELGAAETWAQSGYTQTEPNAIKGFMSCDWEPPYSQHYPGFLGPILGFVASQGAASVSVFPEESVSACAPTYPDTSLPTSNNVTTVAATNLENHLYTAAFYQLATVRSAWMGSVESGQSVQH